MLEIGDVDVDRTKSSTIGKRSNEPSSNARVDHGNLNVLSISMIVTDVGRNCGCFVFSSVVDCRRATMTLLTRISKQTMKMPLCNALSVTNFC